MCAYRAWVTMKKGSIVYQVKATRSGQKLPLGMLHVQYFGALIAGKFQAEGARGLGRFRQQGCRSTASCRNLSAGGHDAHHLM